MDRAIVEAKSTWGVHLHSRKQEGVITLDQTRAAGMSRRQVSGMVERGEWRREYQGVFIDNAAPITPMQPVVAAFFAVGGAASHRLGLWMWAMTSLRRPGALEFSIPYSRNAHATGVKVYRVTAMPPTFYRGVVAVTSPMRAVLDSAAVAIDVVPDAMITAFSKKLFTPGALEAELKRATTNGKPGITALRAALKDLGVGRYTPSQLERRARRLFRAMGLPEPQVEVKFGEHGEFRIDFYWPEADLMIEVDGWSIHATPLARRRDFRKQNRIVIGGHWVLRYDWVDVVYDGDESGKEMLEAYAARTQLPLSG